ncbi:MAG: gephyrin-like molybdotransferase Glp [Sedimentitalea sp.]
MTFDTFVVVDWSARAAPSPVKPTKDAIWIAVARTDIPDVSYHRTRAAAMRYLAEVFATERSAGRRVLAGFDFPFAYPRGFCRALTGGDDPLALWNTIAERVRDDDDNANNRFEVAGDLNDLFPGIGPFWGCPDTVASARLPAKGSLRTDHGLPEHRRVEQGLRFAQTCWKLYTTGSVGSQALLGIARLNGLRAQFGADLSVRPFQSADTGLVLVELFPSLIADTVADLMEDNEIKDAAQVRVLAQALRNLDPAVLDEMTRKGDAEEGGILGVGHETALDTAARATLRPPPLRNDCFALPAGVDWTPVDEALALLRTRLTPVIGQATVPLSDALGRVLAQDVTAQRANPPQANSAVDGFGFAGGVPDGAHLRPLLAGRAAAGVPYGFAVPEGHAIRILTGAALPSGVDTVILEEDVTQSAEQIAFRGPLKRGANARKAGEDVPTGQLALRAGRVLTPADLALASAVGLSDLVVHQKLRVAVISTGDELVEPGAPAGPGQIFDANRPMLLALAARFGFETIDMGRVGDDRGALQASLDAASAQSDVILTSGGASAGDEDHVSALLRETGALQHWRIAVKPGRPLALGMWAGTPVFGLPGNPVAALVCTLVFARPAMGVLAGQGWQEPQGFDVPAAFEKNKKPGRREYLRARIRQGRAEVFASEGSGRISGLSWAEGLVELEDGARHVKQGDLVRYIPYASFGL